MKSLLELLNLDDPAWPVVKDIVRRAVRPVELLPPSQHRDKALLQTQVTTRSQMGAVVYETGGILIDHGWLRLLGSGHPRLTRTLPGWNQDKSHGFYLIADDAIGGFFAINAGALGDDLKNTYYFAPDSLNWEPLNMGYGSFLQWACHHDLELFYKNLRWPAWQSDLASLHGDRCIMTHPPLFTKEGKLPTAKRGQIPVHEAWGMQMDLRRHLTQNQSDTHV